ncbi:hypothetical protein CBS147343_9254 [Aspergillus niger]|uniref:DUF7136 domain-containing protein n=1 Tax=Aspergillus niger TaxID=5061 RepID=A0A9W6A051_ASPNG|nr:hypothetical protein CBS133816_10832 [Aspergillus niger]KAI2843543.1 hypothetical protein CBS12448_10112 [Aspergillus niger]KAI2909546.1 hypothetical protein CBS147371_9570 [Aspergillus niger]KAI2914630.1 hypothetical protein CBS147320_10203 [Aspergillus niger]KAI2942700.1 hypothetical protein CBS147322_8764 [Aspergillus niger]
MAQIFWLLLFLLVSWVRAESNRTEVDLIFPRNDTFAPMPLMPVVFAVQAPSVAHKVNTYIEYGYYPVGRPNETVIGQTDHVSDSTNETTYFSVSGIGRTFNTTGSWELFWRLRWTNCSISEDSRYYNQSYPWISSPYIDGSLNIDKVYEGFHYTAYNVIVDRVTFSTREDASQPNLTTLTNSENCDKVSSLALLSIVDSLRIPPQLPQEDIDTVSMCPQLADSRLNSTSTSSPCSVSISPEVESNILAKIADNECNNALHPAVSCTTEETKEGSASSHDHGHALWLVITLASAFLF